MAKKRVKKDERERIESGDDLEPGEKQYIKEVYKTFPVEEICYHLGRLHTESSSEIINQFIKENFGSKWDREKKKKEEETKDKEFENLYWDDKSDRIKYVESLLDRYAVLPKEDDILNPNEMSRTRMLRYFVDQSDVVEEDEFEKFITIFSDYQRTYKEKLNTADDFQMLLDLCRFRIQLHRQDYYELKGDKRFDAYLKERQIKSINSITNNLALARVDRLKVEGDTIDNISEISNLFGEEEFRKGLEIEDREDAREMMGLRERIWDNVRRAEKEGEVENPDLESDALCYGMEEDELKESDPDNSNKYIKFRELLEQCEEILNEELYIDSNILEKDIKDKFPEVLKFFYGILSKKEGALV